MHYNSIYSQLFNFILLYRLEKIVKNPVVTDTASILPLSELQKIISPFCRTASIPLTNGTAIWTGSRLYQVQEHFLRPDKNNAQIEFPGQ
jgi:hypothetical protein